MSPAEKRLANLKELLKAECLLTETSEDSPYAQDLRLTIKQVKADIKNTNPDGYKMVEV